MRFFNFVTLSPDGAGHAGGIGTSLSIPDANKVDSILSANIKEDERYIYPKFRALSKIVIPGYWINFSVADVLKESASLLTSQTVYANHNTDVTEWLGLVASSSWNDESEPHGIDIELLIDKKHNERIVDGIKLGAVHSGSVGVRFEWTRSHLDSGFNFWDMLGRDIDGRLVTIDVNRILSYDEFSLVYKGADPNAKRKFVSLQVKDDSSAASHDQIFENKKENAGEEESDLAPKEETLRITKKLSQALDLPEGYEFKESDLDKLANDLRIVKEHVQSLKVGVQDLEVKNKNLEALAKIGEATQNALRQETERLCRIVSKDDSSAALAVIARANYAELDELHRMYSGVAEKLHPVENSTRQSSRAGGELLQSQSKQNVRAESYKEER